MVECKKISKEELAAVEPGKICEMKKMENQDVEGQSSCRCPYCGFVGHVPGDPDFVTCINCWDTFRVIW